ncbi:conjugative relaxase-like TrwC/TraI family protein [Methylobacterium fujisawaense]|uniref:Conjugative relaxase-like TrwC/TraI family protein n=1 Tax=Methylobacterium fujisawaense TaxID=107400 RepID=A0ABR6D609_9HYPH|nr:MobF family relaxase [Methylobacterium fujisawaense]MBA9061529.1 conjugative relaxase-like TrwC/TraI family protein [Methylobacterium fujisawaense]
MVATISAGTSARYYLAQVEYYLGGREPEGRWLLTEPALGVIAGTPVARTAFENLHAGRHADGRALLQGGHMKTTDGGARTGGYDITFSAPKSVSVLAALGDDALRDAIEAAQEQAVAEAMRFLDCEAAFCRRGKAGAIREPVRLTVALFRHGEARPAEHVDGTTFADPATHHHAVVVNASLRSDGSFGALDGKAFFTMKMAAGARYHLELASRLQTLGLAIEATGGNGLFEVAGVDPGLCAYFSARRHEIADELAAAGIAHSADAPALAAAKARATRGVKREDEFEAHGGDRRAAWRARAAARGFDPAALTAGALQAGRERAPARKLDRVEALIRARVDAVPRALTETQSLVEHRHLVAGVAAALVETGVKAARADAELARLVAEGAVVALRRDRRWPHPIYSTPEVIALERDLRRMARALAGVSLAGIPDPSRVADLVRQDGLNPEQAEAARLATGPAALCIAEGSPGSGKSTLLRPVSSAWTESGWRVIGAATAWKVAHALRDDLCIEARAVDSWLEGAAHGRPFLTDRTCLIVDEAGLLSSRQLHRILAEVERARAAGLRVAVRLVGDRKQLQPIGGPGLRIVADAVGTTRVDTIVRQREAWTREVVTHLGQGRTAEALALLDAQGAVTECTSSQAVAAAMVAAWSAARAANPEAPAPLLIARTNVQVRALNAGIREVLRREGSLAPTDAATLTAVTSSGRPYLLGLAVGDPVRFLARLDALGVVNGTEAVLTGIEGRGDGLSRDADLRLTARIGGREVSFRPRDLADEHRRIRLASAHATTIYGSQGLTTESALVWGDAGLDRHDAFVAMSRARGVTRLFVDRAGLDARVREERALSDRARPVEADERRATLARLMARSGEKASTLDLAEEIPGQAGRAPPSPEPATVPPPQGGRGARPRHRGRGLGRDG